MKIQNLTWRQRKKLDYANGRTLKIKWTLIIILFVAMFAISGYQACTPLYC